MRSTTTVTRRPRVLVVDDSLSTCLFVTTVLQQAGYDVNMALNGQEALARVMTLHPHCLILDVLLPDISGYALCRHIRQRSPENGVYIILISAKDTPLDQSYGLRQGADRYLPKPFSAQTLVQELWQGVPDRFRSVVLSPYSFMPPPPTHTAQLELIPRRVANPEAMRETNPFASPAVLRDALARRLYLAIDGRKTVNELAAITGLEMQEASRALLMLLKEQCIQLYDAAGQIVEDVVLLAAG
jgi:CheY-like chemotaxis protein